MDLGTDEKTWARELLAFAEFGDLRRVGRAELMLRRAASNPAGRVTEVFATSAERQGAYDFLQGKVRPTALIEAFASATCMKMQAEPAFVVLDGTSLTLTDRAKKKGFGAIGQRGLPTRGLKVVDAVALTGGGVPIGLMDLQFWARGKKSRKQRYARRKQGETETQYWVAAIHASCSRLRAHSPAATVCFIVDREGDNSEIFGAIQEEGGRFIVRAAQDRPVELPQGRPRTLRKHMARQEVRGLREVEVPEAPHRRSRVAQLEVRAARVTLNMPERRSGGRVHREVNVVWAVERRAPRGEKGLDWLVLTSEPIETLDAANAILDAYALRWRIEDFHKTWKSGRCNVEDNQLRAKDHVVRWATMLAAVAIRIEQLKHWARSAPDEPATVAFTEVDIEALKSLKRRTKKQTETVPEGMPTIGQAVRWIGEIGGYEGKSGMPGAITLARGLRRFLPWAEGFAAAQAAQTLAAKPKRKNET